MVLSAKHYAYPILLGRSADRGVCGVRLFCGWVRSVFLVVLNAGVDLFTMHSHFTWGTHT